MSKVVQVFQSRTVLYALVIAALSVLQGFVFLLPITPLQQMYVGVALAVGIVLFRAITTEPLVNR
ncbi:MAG: hypothetical protein U5L73_11275 [Rhodoferax sp.]|uniref:hypothetical protein n=1 Tax=Rhodoferax sp. TaxID=50421 RepID=UPI002ACECCF7|nr:hypothetical protein [Rhodoferax sp.]MDZ7892323.1 hypothetical protein [Rhodoferax sp.]